MNALEIENIFGAPVFYEKQVTSTMDLARRLEQEGFVHGTVITADFQEQGRGRSGRPWQSESGENLVFTILLRFAEIPVALTLKMGLAVAESIEEFGALLGKKLDCKVKWPNDVMLNSKKVAGILSESDGKSVLTGIGVNFAQTAFPAELHAKAGSIAQVVSDVMAVEKLRETRFDLLSLILRKIHGILNAKYWHEKLESKLFRRGEQVRFIEGPVPSGKPRPEAIVKGKLEGLGPNGELLIVPEGSSLPQPFITGELDVYTLY